MKIIITTVALTLLLSTISNAGIAIAEVVTRIELPIALSKNDIKFAAEAKGFDITHEKDTKIRLSKDNIRVWIQIQHASIIVILYRVKHLPSLGRVETCYTY